MQSTLFLRNAKQFLHNAQFRINIKSTVRIQKQTIVSKIFHHLDYVKKGKFEALTHRNMLCWSISVHVFWWI